MTAWWYWVLFAGVCVETVLVARSLLRTSRRLARRIDLLAERCQRDRWWEIPELRQHEMQLALELRSERLGREYLTVVDSVQGTGGL